MPVGPRNPLVCVRTVQIPPENEEAFFAWIQSNRVLRQRYGILMERILRPADGQPTAGQGDWLIITLWESEEAFEKWLAAPEKPAVDASPGHALVKFGKIVRYDTVAGY
jgi:heme-degrading monooxygenase HmoA